MRNTITVLFTVLCLGGLQAQVAKNQVLQINATAENDGITLSWPAKTFTGSYHIFRRSSPEGYNWNSNPLTILNSSATNFKDPDILPGQSAEYWIARVEGSNATAYGYIFAGNQVPEVPYKGGMVLLIDSNYQVPLAAEITRLRNDLEAEGWITDVLYAGRTESPVTVKNRLVPFVKSRRRTVTTLMIIGHVPVPYSGGFTGNGTNYPPPDGHVEGSGNHTGAWPADAYYGDLDGLWEDVNINLTTGNQSRHHNVPGDGKFDPCKLPGQVELEVGRVDLFNMPAFGLSDTVLMRNYFNRNHAWRTGQLKATERALIDDNFTSFNLASTGWHNFSCFFPIDSVFARDYMTELRNNSYLWSYGCGAGSYTSCNGIGTTTNFASDSLRHIFTILAGSFFGDWDIANNLLRAPLGRSALASFWGGIPKWYIHTMALGNHIGFGTRVSMNNKERYFNGGFNASDSSVHIALMGDPSLCNRHLPPARGLKAVSSNKLIRLTWNKSSGDFDSYAIFRHDTAKNIFYRVGVVSSADTSFTDSFNFYTGNYRYIVRTRNLETTGSGSYFNLGGGSSTYVFHLNNLNSFADTPLRFYPNPSTGIIQYEGENLSGFRLYDQSGRNLQFRHNSETKVLDISHLPAGIYILRCQNASGHQISTSIIKQ